MEPLTLKMPPAADHGVECWDDDDDLQGLDDLHLRSASTTTSLNSASIHRSSHRDSMSSRLSHRSDLDSNVGADDDWQVLLPDNDESSHLDAIASAKSAGIPIPTNVPRSALLGGTIKRLGGRKIKRALGEDWSADIELPASDAAFELKKVNQEFPDALRQVSSGSNPSMETQDHPFPAADTITPRTRKSLMNNLDKFRDNDDDDMFGDVPTIKVAKSRTPLKLISFADQPGENHEGGLDQDFEFPKAEDSLKLSYHNDAPKTPVAPQDDFDIDTEWAEGSLGTRFGGTKRGRSPRSSSISALSPSVSSCLTAESDDEGFGGLVLPEGDLKFGDLLKRRTSQSPHLSNKGFSSPVRDITSAPADDFFAGLDVGDGDVFGSQKLTLNRNIKVKTSAQPPSPSRRKATTLTFTNKTTTTTTATRIPRLSHHERPHSLLEPVSESGAALSNFSRRPRSLGGGHSANPSTSSIQSAASTVPSAPSTPQRRGLTKKTSREFMSETTTTSSQLLKAKRSTPMLRNIQSPGKPGFQRPSSQEGESRSRAVAPRAKTPVDRQRPESAAAFARRPPVPFLPAGASSRQSQHISVKTSRTNLRRPGSEEANPEVPATRSNSRLSHVVGSEVTGLRSRREQLTGNLTVTAKRTITRPARRRNFGDGTELEIFDDLPTSATAESKFMKQPIGSGLPKTRSRLALGQQSTPVEPRTSSPQLPATPRSPAKQDSLPRFARDTNASRMAREQRAASLVINPRDRPAPQTQPNTNWKAQVAARAPTSNQTLRHRKIRVPGAQQTKLQLIKPMGNGVQEPKCKLSRPY